MEKEKIYKQLRSYCNRAERCPMDIEVWLRKKEIEGSDCKPFIEQLQEEGLIDENRFIRAFASDKLRFSHWGYYKIRRELLMRNLPEYAVEQITQQVMEEEGEEEILKPLLEKRLFLKLQESEDQGKNFDEEVWKLFDYFVNKGFKREMVVTLGKAILNQFNQELGQK